MRSLCDLAGWDHSGAGAKTYGRHLFGGGSAQTEFVAQDRVEIPQLLPSYFGLRNLRHMVGACDHQPHSGNTCEQQFFDGGEYQNC